MSGTRRTALGLAAVILVGGAACRKPHAPRRQPPAPLHAPAASMDPALLTLVQRKAFDFFWDGAHTSGLSWDSVTETGLPPGPMLATGATGMGVMAIVVGVERGFVTRQAGAARVAKILEYLRTGARRYHGAWPHWLDPATGEGIGPEGNDSFRKGDIVETAFVAEGLLTASRYFDDPEDPAEANIRAVADELWRDIDWRFYWDEASGAFRWHWSSDSGFDCPSQTPVQGFNEAMIVYLLGMASPTHPVPVSAYARGWAPPGYTTDASYRGIRQWVQTFQGGGMNVSLFWTHYSFLGFDPRAIRDPQLGQAGAPAGFTYHDVFRDLSLVNRAYHLDMHPENGDHAWGLTASMDPWGYGAHSPMPSSGGDGDNGTVAPTAALGAMPYAPDEAYAALVAFRAVPGLWGKYGFRDAYHPGRRWTSDRYIGIDEGPIVLMIENHRTRLLWRLFMSHPAIADPATGLLAKLEGAGWTITRQKY
ncbi:MAG: glucoamylase family protein [Anaeromyxobacteraceae bacterium]